MTDFDALDRLLMGRRSCRGYTAEQVPRDVIEKLLTTAQRTPSWCNTQPWHVTVTSGDATDALREVLFTTDEGYGVDFDFPTAYTGVHQERRRESGWQLYGAVGIQKGDREASTAEGMKNFALFGAPHVAIITTEADLGVYGAIDCGLYIDSFLLAAQGLGLGACAQAALAARSPLLHERFGIPDTRKVVCGISFGYADESHPTASYRTSRAGLAEAVTWVS